MKYWHFHVFIFIKYFSLPKLMNESSLASFFFMVMVQGIRMFYQFINVTQAILKIHSCTYVWNCTISFWISANYIGRKMLLWCKRISNWYYSEFFVCPLYWEISSRTNELFNYFLFYNVFALTESNKFVITFKTDLYRN